MRAWLSGRFVSAPGLPGWWGEPWSLPLIPGWQELIGRPLAEVAAVQWLTIAQAIREDLKGMDPARVAIASFESILMDPEASLRRLCDELSLTWSAALPDGLLRSPFTLTDPGRSPTDGELFEIKAAFGRHDGLVAGFTDFAEAHGVAGYDEIAMPMPIVDEPVTRPSAGTPFRSGHSESLTELLEASSSSIILSTYKSGHLIIARSFGGGLDTTVTALSRPMGIACAGGRLSVGTEDSVVSYRNHPQLAGSMAGQRPHDAVFVPRSIIVTGDVAIHEMAHAASGDLWFVNTRFSCLATLDMTSSFEPQWRPQWISGLAAEDRCHLNGLAMVDGTARFVTALSQTDTPNGWRAHKGTSGVIVDVTTDDVIADGLSMPHSPRWHDGQLWVLESGIGAICRVDVATGARIEVARLPGFTRGLGFIGRYALVGLSQVRESVFAGLPVTGTANERNAGVWVVDTITGATVGLLRFDGVVQEVFDVQVLVGSAWPQITDPGEYTASAFTLSPQTISQLAPAS